MDNICLLVDSFGHDCCIDGCEEFRTVGVRMMIATEDGGGDWRLTVLCRDHLVSFLDAIVFHREKEGLYDANLGKRIE